MKRITRIAAGLTVGLVISFALFGAVYQQFSPGGALSGTWNSQNVNVGAAGSLITGTLAFGHGGTGVATAADDTTLVSSGSAWAATAIPNCGDSTHALAYATASNAFSCQSVTGSGASLSTGSWTTTLTTGCTTQPTQAWTYSQISTGTGSIVTISGTATTGCTSNAGTLTSASGSVPAAIRPTRTVNFTGLAGTDNSAAAAVCLSLLADGTLAYLRQSTAMECGASTFNASGAKGVNFGTGSYGTSTFTYRID
jgi:hypothetical protein